MVKDPLRILSLFLTSVKDALRIKLGDQSLTGNFEEVRDVPSVYVGRASNSEPIGWVHILLAK